MANPLITFDINKSLLELNGQDWTKSPPYITNLVRKVERLGTIPLKDFTNEDLRLMIGQQFSLKFLVPIALERLAENEFISGDMYAGDIVQNLLEINHDFWLENEDLHWEFSSIVIGVRHTIETLTPALNKFKAPQ